MKIKEMNKETFVLILWDRNISCKLQKEIYSYKNKDMYIFGWRNIHLYTYKEKRVNETSRLEHACA